MSRRGACRNRGCFLRAEEVHRLRAGRVEAGVQYEWGLRVPAVAAIGGAWFDHQVPTESGDGTGKQHDAVLRQELATERLLAGAGRAWDQPGGVGHVLWLYDVNGFFRDLDAGEYMRLGVQYRKTCMDCNLKDGSAGVHGAVHGALSFGVPAAAQLFGADAAVPGSCVVLPLQAPREHGIACPELGDGRHWVFALQA